MSKLEWDQSGERFYETGVDRGVLYPYATVQGVTAPGAGIAWNGLSSVSESPEGAEATSIYADNIKYLSLRSVEDFKGTIEAYTYPEEWEECDGSKQAATGLFISQQARKTFGLSYRTKIGNDVDGDEKGYKLHLVYGGTASPSEKQYTTVNDSPEAVTFSWEFETVPVTIPGYKASARLTVDSTKANEDCLAQLEAVLYGVDTADAPTYAVSTAYSKGTVVKKTEGTTTTYYMAKVAIPATEASWTASHWLALDSAGPRLPLPSEVITILTPAV